MNPPPLARRLVFGLAGTFAVLAAAGACASGGAKFSGPDGDRRLYEARCGFCHVPYLPSDFEPEEWPDLVAEMAGRSGLTKAQTRRVTDYLVRESRAALGAGR